MKKHLALVVTGILIFASCQKSVTHEEETISEPTSLSFRQCASHEVLQAQLSTDPGLQQRMNQIEDFIQQYLNNPAARLLADSVIEIPVVFNVLYRTSAENISLVQLQSQIDVLNDDFAAGNLDYNSTPSLFQGVRSGDIKVRFVLDQVIRKSTRKKSWSTNNAMKFNSQGGINATDPTIKLNIWVCNMGGGILGYAQFPGGSTATDGVVLDDRATGNTGTALAPYGLGRTATHEVGHWLNLRHIWGDATCGNDFVNDTPVHNTSNGGCPAYPHLSTCAGNPVEMTMNYMDYTYDACMYMFTIGQKNRMRATFGSGGGRTTFAQP